jgi:3-isopropylmalate dehydrogenase
MAKILVLPGDGIGQEVTAEAVGVLEVVAKKRGIKLDISEGLVGGASIDRYGVPLMPEVLAKAKSSDAILLGAVGGPKWEPLDFSIRPERALLTLRGELSLFANLRPARVFSSLIGSSTLKKEVVEGVDLIVVRELVGGLYFSKPRGVETLPNGQKRGVNTLCYTTGEIERIGRVAFDLALKRRKKLTSVDKANVLECTELWRNVISELHKEFPKVELGHMYVDNCAMQLIRNPNQFDVIVTENMFGDILSDEASMLTGSIGMLPSASIGSQKSSLGGPVGMYEPVHGSAPDIAGRGVANPLATILSIAMMMRYTFADEGTAKIIEEAVNDVLKEGFRTADLGPVSSEKFRVGTTKMGQLVLDRLL